MTNNRTILRAFLASPGDMQEEREGIRDVVDEFNGSWADELGYQIELVGWEDTVPGYGRPQHLINQDVDRCDLFIAMVWKRWGTPPGHSSTFSSGFEEEFERAMERRRQTETPQIALFFKQVSDELRDDPGEHLKKVQEFREKLIAQKEIFFQEVSTAKEMEKLVRKCITEYVNGVRAQNLSSDHEETRSKPTDRESEKVEPKDTSSEASPLSREGFTFLGQFVDKIGKENAIDNLTASEVARFRLLANSVSKSGNQEMGLGVHDINILFAARTNGMTLGRREIQCLMNLGFRFLPNENVPLWCWYSYSASSYSPLDPATISSITGVNDDEKVGAIRVLTALEQRIATENLPITRERILKLWFSEGSSVPVRIAALAYLAKMGTEGDYSLVKQEYDKNDHGTSRHALECMVAIAHRTESEIDAQGLVLESQFESLDVKLLTDVLEGFDHIETDALFLGLEHRNARVRLRAFRILLDRKAVDLATVERLFEDHDALVRNEAIAALDGFDRTFSMEEIKRILVRPPQPPVMGLRGLSGVNRSDQLGEKLFAQHQKDRLRRQSEKDLTKDVETGTLVSASAYFVRAERYFKKYADELRGNVDDRFNSFFDERISRMETLFANLADGPKVVEETRDMKESWRKRLTRQGLDILGQADCPEDLPRIKFNLQEGYTSASKVDALYLGRHGEWTDIRLLVIADPPSIGGLLGPRDDHRDFQNEVPRALLRMARGYSMSMLLSIEMPAVILEKTIKLCTIDGFSKISDDALFGLLNHDSADVRKATAIKAVQSLSKKRIRSILREYVKSDRYRYYNVIHWLDLGASMSRDEARRVIRAAHG